VRRGYERGLVSWQRARVPLRGGFSDLERRANHGGEADQPPRGRQGRRAFSGGHARHATVLVVAGTPRENGDERGVQGEVDRSRDAGGRLLQRGGPFDVGRNLPQDP